MAKRKTKADRDAEVAAQKQAIELREAENFGRAVRREHEALGKLLIMLDHITGMPTVPGVVEEARQAFADIRARSLKISTPQGCEIGLARWTAR